MCLTIFHIGKTFLDNEDGLRFKIVGISRYEDSWKNIFFKLAHFDTLAGTFSKHIFEHQECDELIRDPNIEWSEDNSAYSVSTVFRVDDLKYTSIDYDERGSTPGDYFEFIGRDFQDTSSNEVFEIHSVGLIDGCQFCHFLCLNKSTKQLSTIRCSSLIVANTSKYIISQSILTTSGSAKKSRQCASSRTGQKVVTKAQKMFVLYF